MQKFGLFVAIVALLAAAGCNDGTQGKPLTKEEEAAFRAAPGQPMPEEAKRYMEKANREAQERAKQGNAPPGAAAPPPGPAAPR